MRTGRMTAGTVLLAWAQSTDGADETHAHGHALLVELAAEITGTPPRSLDRRCPHCGSSDHGAPFLADVALSLSYAGSLVVAAAAARTAQHDTIGIDAESSENPDRMLEELTPLFSPSSLFTPAPTVRQWTLYEAAAKVDGRGLRLAPEHIEARAEGDGIRFVFPDRAAAVISMPVIDGVPPGVVISLARSSHEGSAR